MKNRTFILVDGENLVFRFQASLNDGFEKGEATKHIPDVFVWNHHVTAPFFMEVIRVSFYSTQVGDEVKLDETRKAIASYSYNYRVSRQDSHSQGYICPHIFKKERNNQKTKSVDINLTIDALRHTYNDSLDILFLLSGDGDYIPLIEEVMRQGKKVVLGAFSNGLNPALEYTADQFINLDHWFLKGKTKK
jgi:uncharacterized LabA/DUF88 family protein